jgi:UDP-glucose 4-epimerase/UDP-glucuronate decarboxylase
MRHLVTGAAGVIGFELVRALLARGERVVAVDRGLKGGLDELRALAAAHPDALTCHELDLAAPGALAWLAGPWDAVFHLAAIVGVRYVTEHPYETLAANTRSTLAVLDHVLAHRARALLFASSSENYASGVDLGFVPVPTPEDVPLSVADIALPRWSYAASKIAGESAVFGAAPLGGFTPVVVRFHNVYGPRMGPTHVIPEMLERCARRVDPFPIFGSDQTRSFLHVADTARALVAVMHAALAGSGGIVNIGSDRETRIGELARRIFEVTGFHPRVDERPAPPGSVGRRVPGVQKLAALGFRPEVSLDAGLAECWRARQARSG